MIQDILTIFSDLPDVLQIIIAIFITFVGARFVASIVIVVFKRMVSKTKTSLDDQIAHALEKPLFYTVVFAGLTLIALVPDFVEPYERQVLALFYTMLIFLWTIFVISLMRIIVRYLAGQEDRAAVIKIETAPLFENLFVIVAVAFAVYLMFSIWGINMTAWLASAGVVGIAVGFAAKDTLANLFSGIFILADAPYKIGDYIVLDSGERGRVINVGIRSTRMVTRDEVEVTIPNAVMSGTKIVNESGGPKDRYRVRAIVGVSYDSDIDKVEEILLSIPADIEGIVEKPKPLARFKSFGDSALEFHLLAWIEKPEQRSKILHNINRAIHKRFKDEGIEIPFPQRVVHMTKND